MWVIALPALAQPAGPCMVQAKSANSATSVITTAPAVCVAGQKYAITIDDQGRKIHLRSERRTHLLHRIPKGFEPSLVGADKFVGFLPDHLQLYREKKVVLYVSAIRSNGGSGGGQCGAGAEIYLHVLDLKPAHPKHMARHLIGSCSGIELDNFDQSTSALGDITIADGRLVFKFLFYRGYHGSPAATLSSDFARLEFNAERTN